METGLRGCRLCFICKTVVAGLGAHVIGASAKRLIQYGSYAVGTDSMNGVDHAGASEGIRRIVTMDFLVDSIAFQLVYSLSTGPNAPRVSSNCRGFRCDISGGI